MIKVIVIDDDLDCVDSLEEFFSAMKIQVVGKGYNGKDAFELYKQHQPDIVLLDMKMPEYDGVYALTHIKSFDPNAKIIVITGYSDYKFNANEVEVVLSKPYDIDELVDIVKNLALSKKSLSTN